MNTHHTTLVKTLTTLALFAAVALTGRAVIGITGTPHDLTTNAWAITDQKCIFCHTPHNAKTTQLIPLWNHGATTTTFTLYQNTGTLNATMGQPAGTSKACLSCHDGTVALDSYGTSAGTAATKMAAGDIHNLGTSLADDHPISFLYDSVLALADVGLISPTSASFVDGASKIPLFAGMMECASCHNVHDNTNGSFLRVSNTGSALCLKCHIK